MAIRNVVVAGGGVLGSQIAFQCSYRGFDVTVWLRSQGSIDRAKPKFEHLRDIYKDTLERQKALIGRTRGMQLHARGLFRDFANATPESIDMMKKTADGAYASLRMETDLAKAVEDADILIEALTEDPDQKRAFYKKLAPLLPEKTIVCTNSSTLLPSMFAEDTGRPEKFLALHFANEIWRNNTAEVMGHPGTDPDVYQQVVKFASSIGMVPLQLKKEQPGYILNSMLVPFLNAAEVLLAKGVADPETIDTTWKLATGAPTGPFQILDVVGLKTAYDIVIMDPQAQDPETIQGKIAATLKEYIDEGKTGVATGEGFYKYR